MEASIELNNVTKVEEILREELLTGTAETKREETLYDNERTLHAKNIEYRHNKRRKTSK